MRQGHVQPMTKNSRQHHLHAPRTQRGSILILVVGVLVLLMITATIYVRVGRLERTSSTATEVAADRTVAATKVIDYIGSVLTADLYGNDLSSDHPFEDPNPLLDDRFGFVGERWDYPYTRPGEFSLFNRQADPWLASTELTITPLGNQYEWVHLSNISQNGRFVDLAKLIDNYYEDMFDYNNDPHVQDTRYRDQVVDGGFYPDYMIDKMDNTSIGYVTMADRRQGDDTDGDGYIDARWTELIDIYGNQNGMRVFTAVRIVDLSSMLNINANIEIGLSQNDGPDGTVGYGRTPADIDLLTFMSDSYRWLEMFHGPSGFDNAFMDGHTGVGGFREHVMRMGVLEHAGMSKGDFDYLRRIPRPERNNVYSEISKYSYRSHKNMKLYDVVDEIELRTSWTTTNDLATSRFEQYFDDLNFSVGPYVEDKFRLSPLRNWFPHEVNYNNGNDLEFSWNQYPTIPMQDWYYGNESDSVPGDIRHFLTTYNGAYPAAAWNRAGREQVSSVKPNLNRLLMGADEDLQAVTGAIFWALAPYAVQRSDVDISNPVYGLQSSFWLPDDLQSGMEMHYGYGDAGYAYLKAAQLAVNARDAIDYDTVPEDLEPTIRTLHFRLPVDVPLGYDREFDIAGSFDHGRIPDELMSRNSSEDQYQNQLTLIGLERQPFLVEVATLVLYTDGDLFDGIYDIDPNNADDQYAFLVAFELGNPWDEDLSVADYHIEFGGETFSLSLAPDIPAGERLIVISGPADGATPNLTAQWESVIDGRNGSVGTVVHVLPNQDFTFDGSEEEVLLWWDGVEFDGGTHDILIDRLRASHLGSQLGEFPNLLDAPIVGYDVLPNPEGAYSVHSSSMRRYAGTTNYDNDSSFPGYIFQSPDTILASGNSSDDMMEHPGGFTDPDGPFLSDRETDGVLIDLFNHSTQHNRKGYTAGSEPSFAPFQLYVPNLKANGVDEEQDFRSPVDLLMLTSVTHINTDQSDTVGFSNEDSYITISEQLGDEALDTRTELGIESWLWDVVRPSGVTYGISAPDFRIVQLGDDNPFVGKIDYTRFIARDAGYDALPHQAVPMGIRLLDAFDMLVDSAEPDRLPIQGRININTATKRVLRQLPYLYPVYDAGPIPARNPNLQLADTIIAYRDREQIDAGGHPGIDWRERWDGGNLLTYSGVDSGLRDDWTEETGFVSIGELLLLTQWRTLGSDPDRFTHEPPDPTNLSLRNQSLTLPGHNIADTDFEPLDPNVYSDFPDTHEYDPADDVTEWMSLVRGLSNNVTVRSDVYVAYISVVGITVSDIEQAKEDANRFGTGDLEELRPTMDQRYMVVFDRSNVKKPSDRPRVLFAARELPHR